MIHGYVVRAHYIKRPFTVTGHCPDWFRGNFAHMSRSGPTDCGYGIIPVPHWNIEGAVIIKGVSLRNRSKIRPARIMAAWCGSAQGLSQAG
jgi:hypothetical protein